MNLLPDKNSLWACPIPNLQIDETIMENVIPRSPGSLVKDGSNFPTETGMAPRCSPWRRYLLLQGSTHQKKPLMVPTRRPIKWFVRMDFFRRVSYGTCCTARKRDKILFYIPNKWPVWRSAFKDEIDLFEVVWKYRFDNDEQPENECLLVWKCRSLIYYFNLKKLQRKKSILEKLWVPGQLGRPVK